MKPSVYTAHVRVTGGRDNGRGRTPDGMLDLPLRLPKELGGTGDGANPEQLFAIGYAGCFEAVMIVGGQRLGINLLGPAWSEGRLIRLGYAFERGPRPRR